MSWLQDSIFMFYDISFGCYLVTDSDPCYCFWTNTWFGYCSNSGFDSGFDSESGFDIGTSFSFCSDFYS